METHVLPPDDARATTLDAAAVEHELRMVHEAIALVASGVTPRVIVANIKFGSVLLDAARRMALASGLRIRPLWRADMEADLSVELIQR